MLRASGEQVVAFRAAALHLDRRLPANLRRRLEVAVAPLDGTLGARQLERVEAGAPPARAAPRLQRGRRGREAG